MPGWIGPRRAPDLCVSGCPSCASKRFGTYEAPGIDWSSATSIQEPLEQLQSRLKLAKLANVLESAQTEIQYVDEFLLNFQKPANSPSRRPEARLRSARLDSSCRSVRRRKPRPVRRLGSLLQIPMTQLMRVQFYRVRLQSAGFEGAVHLRGCVMTSIIRRQVLYWLMSCGFESRLVGLGLSSCRGSRVGDIVFAGQAGPGLRAPGGPTTCPWSLLVGLVLRRQRPSTIWQLRLADAGVEAVAHDESEGEGGVLERAAGQMSLGWQPAIAGCGLMSCLLLSDCMATMAAQGQPAPSNQAKASETEPSSVAAAGSLARAAIFARAER
uniref:SKA2 domain-containing protein n=1 Tax=Macrostomum lignano TaxID=282301 RepID=A0A1I8JP50_9PLAT